MQESDIAIVGLGAMLPDALDVDACWRLITGKHSAIREIPGYLWDVHTYYDADPKAPYRTNSKIGSFLPEDIGFHTRDFGMPPILKDHLDPTQQLALLTARQALADAQAIDRQPRRWAVYVGNLLGGSWKRGEQWIRTQHEITLRQLRQSEVYRRQSVEEQQALEEAIRLQLPWSKQPSMTPDSLPGLLGNLIASRIAHYFNLTGPNFTVDAACATSLAAVELSVLGLRQHRFDAALCGGVDRIMDASSFIGFSKMGVLSPTHSAPFDASANGFVMGEGAAMFVLKRLSDALAHQDRIYAVIRGVGSSTDGPGRAIAAPNPEGQSRALHQAYLDAQLDPASVDLLECHGTSTPIGDPSETAALRPYWQDRDRNKPVAIGSIKANIGHLKGAAGAAALLKATLALYHQVLPPQINFHTPNPHCEFETTPFRVQTEAEPWERSSGPRRCGVSSFGFGGINYHLVLEEFSMSHSTTGFTTGLTAGSGTTGISGSPSSLQPAPLPLGMNLVALGAADRRGLVQEIRRALGTIDATGSFLWLESLRAAPTLAQQPCRVAFYADTIDEQRDILKQLADALEQDKSLKKLEARGVALREGAINPGRVALMFPGQGSQYVYMLNDLRKRFPIVQQTLDEADAIMADLLPKPLSSYICPPADVDEDTAFFELLQTEILQPAVLTADYAMWRLLSPLLPVELVMGHSLGEYAAAIAAGVFSFADALRIVAARGEAIAAVADQMDDVGVMIGVGTDAKTVEPLLEEIREGYVIVANKNCPTQTIIAGATQPTMKAAALLESKGFETVQLPVSHAFHSNIVAPASPFLLAELKKIDVHPPKLMILSNVTAKPYPTGPDAPSWIRDTLSVHLARPVEWQAMTEWAYDQGFRTFVEAGPKRALSSFVHDILGQKPHVSYFSSHPKFGELPSLGRMLAALTADGLLPYGTERPVSSTTTSPNKNNTDTIVKTEIVSAQPPSNPKQTQVSLPFIPAIPAQTSGQRMPQEPGATTVSATHPEPTLSPMSQQVSYVPFGGTPTQAFPGPTDHTATQPSAFPGYPVPPMGWNGGWPQAPGWPQAYASPHPAMMPHYGHVPMMPMPQPWFDPGFWQFVSAQWPMVVQQLWFSYRTMMAMSMSMPVSMPFTAGYPASHPMQAPSSVPTHFPGYPASSVHPVATQPVATHGSMIPQTTITPTITPTPPGWNNAFAAHPSPALGHKATASAAPVVSQNSVISVSPAQSASTPSIPSVSTSVNNPVPAQTVTPAAPSVPTQVSHTPAPKHSPLGGDDLASMILTLVAERTGYEVAELGLDEHLEADLGIDSIRQVEVMAELRDVLKLPRDDSFRITDYPTLRSLITYVQQHVPRGRESSGSRSSSGSREASEPSG